MKWRMSSRGPNGPCLIGLLAIGMLLNGGCGGGFPPKGLQSAAVDCCNVAVRKKLIYTNPAIGLVHGIFQAEETGEFAVIGGQGSCMLSLSGNIVAREGDPDKLGIIPPVTQIGSFITDGYIQADFDNNGKLERVSPVASVGFKLEKASGEEVARTQIDVDHWFEPKATWSQPHFLLVSTDGMLLVFDDQLRRVRNLPLPGIKAPLHIEGGAPLGRKGSVPFVSVFGGRGGWHRSILFIHSPDEHVIYKEILADDFKAVWPLPEEDGKYRFLLGGRGQVWEYSFTLGSMDALTQK